MPTLAVSSWSLHRTLGPIYPGLQLVDGRRSAEQPFGPGTMMLEQLPAAVAARGIHALEICHFHFPQTDLPYLQLLRQRLDEAGVQPLTLLIDDGDVTAADPAARRRELEQIRAWIDIAAQIGARQARVIAGYASPDEAGEAVQRSIEGLSMLARYAASRSVRLITENWHALSMQPEHLLAILDGTGGSVGLCADFGNYPAATRYDALPAILPRATSIHAKAEYRQAAHMDAEDFRRCLDLARAAGFSGAYVLIFEGPGDEWASLSQMADVVRPYL